MAFMSAHTYTHTYREMNELKIIPLALLDIFSIYINYLNFVKIRGFKIKNFLI